MNFKKQEILISVAVIFIFTSSLIIYLNNILLDNFLFLKEHKFLFSTILIIFFSIIFLTLFYPLLSNIFKNDLDMEKRVKTTLHELNIPSSTIKLNIQLLKQDLTNEKSLKRLQRVELANENLIKLYENLEYEIKKGISKVDFEKFSLSEAINISLEKFEDIKKDTKIELEIEDIYLNSDLNGFILVLDNLISNAIKYNSKENPYIKISYKNGILSFFNKGKAIDAKNIILVFDSFFQENSDKKGFGLGLAIVKEYCDRNRVAININNIEDGVKISLNLKNIVKQA